MKNMWKLFWGLGFIIVAVALVLDAFGIFAPLSGIFGEISIFALVGGFLLLCFALSELVKGNAGNFFFALALIFMIFEKNVAHFFNIGDENGNIINNWLLLLVAILLGVGFSILFSGVRRRRRARRNRHSGCEWSYGDNVKVRGSIGSSVRYIDCEGFKYEAIENDLGACTVFFENVDKYEGGGVLSVENNLGSITVTVPEDWNVVTKIDNSLGSVTSPKPNYDGPTLTVTGENNLGAILIKTAKRAAEESDDEPDEKSDD